MRFRYEHIIIFHNNIERRKVNVNEIEIEISTTINALARMVEVTDDGNRTCKFSRFSARCIVE